ncbi:MAG: hypothetical protein AAB673_01350 [Patescibacteria group bacterium]
MKRTAAMAVIFSVLLAANVASAAEKEIELEFDKVKLWNLAGLPGYFFLENLLHESSHALMAMSLGEEIDSFKPYPHRNEDGIFLLGGFVSSADHIPKRDTALVALAPYLTDTVFFVSTDLLLSYHVIEPRSVGGLIVYSVGMLAPFVDLVYNAHGFGKYNDFVIFSKAAGVNRFTTLAITEGVVMVAAVRLIMQGLEVFSKNTEPAKELPKPASVMIVPILGNSMTGLGASFTF